MQSDNLTRRNELAVALLIEHYKTVEDREAFLSYLKDMGKTNPASRWFPYWEARRRILAG